MNLPASRPPPSSPRLDDAGDVPWWRRRRVWRWTLAAALVLAVLVVAFRQPLADRIWPDTRIQQLLEAGNAALRAGRLSSPGDGQGARELFEAAQALDADRPEPGQGLARTGQAALAQAQAALQQGDYRRARTDLQLATELQMPQPQVQAVAARVRAAESGHAQVEQLLAQAARARAEGRLDGTPDSALPLYQQVLAIEPDRTAALEGREDALADLLQRARADLRSGELGAAAAALARARGYDPGHYDLPETEAAFSTELTARLRQAERDLRLGRLDAAAAAFGRLHAAVPDDPMAAQGVQRTAGAYAAEAARQAADFHFARAARLFERAEALDADAPGLADARQAIERSHAAQASMQSRLAPAERERQLQRVLAELDHAGAQGHWLTPPGASAYDKLREAQALAPHDPRVRRAAARIVPQTRQCFEQALRENRVRAAGACLDTWGWLAPSAPGVREARRRLAQRWIAVGQERLGAGDLKFARQAVQQARALDAATPELAAFERRVGRATP